PHRPPQASLTTPGNGASISGTATFASTASDEHGVRRVEFWCDGSVLLGTATTAPYSIASSTTNMANGLHTFTCKAYDTAGQPGTSAANTATVNNATTGTPGQLQLVKTMQGTYACSAISKGVAADHSGNVVSAGTFQGTVNLGTGPISSILGTWDGFVAKYDSQGSLLWVMQLGNNED